VTEMSEQGPGIVFAVSACIFLHRQGEILILKRAGGIESGGWFAPGGHIETYTILPSEGLHHLGIVYLAPFPGGEVVLNEEHSGFRWVTPEYYRDRFLDPDRLIAFGLRERSIATARELRRVVEVLIAVITGSN
jgi:8-oxo-dGTP pyrophosphatase MutT (NUDIX family)